MRDDPPNLPYTRLILQVNYWHGFPPPRAPPPPDFSVGANTLCVMFVVGLVFLFLSPVFFNIEIRGVGGFGPRLGLHEGAKSLAILIGSTVRGFLPKLTFSKK